MKEIGEIMDLIFPYLNIFALPKNVSLMYLCIALLIVSAQKLKKIIM